MSFGTQDTTTTTEPWSGVKPYLFGGYKDAQSLYNKGAPGYYPNSTVAPQSQYTQQGIDAMANRAQQGSALTDAAQGQLSQTLNGDYLNNNPHLQGAIDSATRPVLDSYTNTIMPGLNSQFSSAGRYGSGAHAMASGDAAQNLMRQVGDIGTNMAYQNYGDERQRQIQGMLFAPELANQDYRDIGMLQQAGGMQDQYSQNLINADIAKYNYNNNKDWNYLSDYLGLLNGATGSSSTTTQPGPNPITGALGGGLMGASIGSMMAPAGATGLAALGGPFPLAIGAGLGLLGSIF